MYKIKKSVALGVGMEMTLSLLFLLPSCSWLFGRHPDIVKVTVSAFIDEGGQLRPVHLDDEGYAPGVVKINVPEVVGYGEEFDVIVLPEGEYQLFERYDRRARDCRLVKRSFNDGCVYWRITKLKADHDYDLVFVLSRDRVTKTTFSGQV